MAAAAAADLAPRPTSQPTLSVFPPCFTAPPEHLTANVGAPSRGRCGGGAILSVTAGGAVHMCNGCGNRKARIFIMFAGVVVLLSVAGAQLAFPFDVVKHEVYVKVQTLAYVLSLLFAVVATVVLPLIAVEWIAQSQDLASSSRSRVKVPFLSHRIPQWAIMGVYCIEEWLTLLQQQEDAKSKQQGGSSVSNAAASLRAALLGQHRALALDAARQPPPALAPLVTAQEEAPKTEGAASSSAVVKRNPLGPDSATASVAPDHQPPHSAGASSDLWLSNDEVEVVQYEWVWPLLAIVQLIVSFSRIGVIAAAQSLFVIDGAESILSSILGLFSTLLQYCAPVLVSQLMWAAACLYVARQAQAMKLLMLDSRLSVHDRCERITIASTKLSAMVGSWSSSLGLLALFRTVVSLGMAISYAVGTLVRDDEGGISGSDTVLFALTLLSTVEVLCFLIPPVVTNAEVASLTGTALRMLPGVQGWTWNPEDTTSLWSVESTKQPGTGPEEASPAAQIQRVRMLQAHLQYVCSPSSQQTVNISLGGLVVTGPLVVKVLTIVYSAYYGLLAFVGVGQS